MMFKKVKIAQTKINFIQYFLFLLITFSFPLSANSQTAIKPSGTGTSQDPYLVSTWQNLYWMSQNPTDCRGEDFLQINDISFPTSGDDNIENWDEGAGWLPICSDTDFRGLYDGGGYNISNLYINRPASSDFVGFFAYGGWGSSIQNVNLVNLDVTGGGSDTGGLVGYAGSTTIKNCSCQGNISGNGSDVGGLIGRLQGSTTILDSSFSNCTVEGLGNVGGLVGWNNNSSTITFSYSRGIVYNSGSNTGGLVGRNYNGAVIENCYSRSTVNGTIDCGGLVGNNSYNYSLIENCYSTGTVGGSANLGGLIGNNSSTVNNSFWDTQTSLHSASAAGTGKNTEEMKNIFTYINAGWDFAGETENGSNDSWDKDPQYTTNDGYPTFVWQNNQTWLEQPHAGEGTAENPYQIENLKNLYWLSQYNNVWDKNFEQSIDINASETTTWNNNNGFEPIGNSEINFTGSYNGQGYKVSQLSIDKTNTDNIGLFGYTDEAYIKNLGLDNVNITGYQYVGGLVGNNNFSKIENCFCTGNIYGNSYTGGLIGGNSASSLIKQSFSKASVIGSAGSIGGLLGTNVASKINNSYSTGSVEGSSYIGGLVGSNTASSQINYSYSKGAVSGTSDVGGLVGFESSSSTNNSCWDKQTSGQTYSAGGSGTTTAEMTTNALIFNYNTNIYLAMDWDFKGETTNGTQNIWNIGNSRNNGYPYLSWEYPDDPATLPVELSLFTAQYINNKAQLFWRTQSETDNIGWFIYRNTQEHFPGSIQINTNLIPGCGTTTVPHTYIYIDSSLNPSPGNDYYYWLESIDLSGTANISDPIKLDVLFYEEPSNHGAEPETKYGLHSIKNNPFSPALNKNFISLNLNKKAKVKLDIFNIKGQLVKNMITGYEISKNISWDGRNDKGHVQQSGIYLYRLLVNGIFYDSEKIILTK